MFSLPRMPFRHIPPCLFHSLSLCPNATSHCLLDRSCFPDHIIWHHSSYTPNPLYHTLLISFSLVSCPLLKKTKWSEVKVTQSCPTLCGPMDHTVHGILQARILEWVAFPFSRESSQLRDQTLVSCIVGRFFTSWATREAWSRHISAQ